jgi:hypothetical protein
LTQTLGRSGGVGVGCDPARSGDQPGGGSGREGGPQELGTAALGAHPGDEEDRPRHQLPHAAEVAGLGGSDNRSHPAQRPLPRQPVGELVDEAGKTLVQRQLRRRQVLQVGGTRIAGADEGEHPSPGLRRGGGQRLEGVAAEQGVGGESVGTEALHGPPGGRRFADQSLGVGGGGDRDVAALAVGDDQQAGVAGRCADLFQGAPTGRAETLEAGELRLDRDASWAGPVDQGAAMVGDRGGRQLGGWRFRVAGLRPLPGQLGRVGVEAEADLAAALFDERRQPINKGTQ